MATHTAPSPTLNLLCPTFHDGSCRRSRGCLWSRPEPRAHFMLPQGPVRGEQGPAPLHRPTSWSSLCTKTAVSDHLGWKDEPQPAHLGKTADENTRFSPRSHCFSLPSRLSFQGNELPWALWITTLSHRAEQMHHPQLSDSPGITRHCPSHAGVLIKVLGYSSAWLTFTHTLRHSLHLHSCTKSYKCWKSSRQKGV